MRLRIVTAALAICVGTVAPLSAAAQWDTSLDTIYWRMDCTGFDPSECVDSPEQNIGFALWLLLQRQPTEATPLLVDVGPGRFIAVLADGSTYYEIFPCLHSPPFFVASHITLRGAGPGITVIGDPSLEGLRYPLVASHCENLHVQDLTLASPEQGVWWDGGGSSTWQNVEIIGQKTAWFDASCGGADRAVHYFFSSRIRTNGESDVAEATAMDVCSENWLYASEVSALGSASSSASLTELTALKIRSGAAGPGDVRLFGSAIRAGSLELAAGHPAFGQATGVKVNGGTFHSHGGIINATTSNVAGASATGLSVSGSASFAHTPGTAFVVKPGVGGTGTRVAELSGGTAQSPFLWQAGEGPPVAGLTSADGADVYIEVDCDASGDCDGAGNETHMMIYNQAKCGAANPWFDSTVGACRQ